AAQPVGSLDLALAHALELLDQHPSLALEQATEILNSVPAHPIATLLVGMAQRRLGDTSAALATLEPLSRSQPHAAAVHYEYGLALGAARQGEAAVKALRRAVDLSPALPGAWRALADHLTAMGDPAGALCRCRRPACALPGACPGLCRSTRSLRDGPQSPEPPDGGAGAGGPAARGRAGQPQPPQSKSHRAGQCRRVCAGDRPVRAL